MLSKLKKYARSGAHSQAQKEASTTGENPEKVESIGGDSDAGDASDHEPDVAESADGTNKEALAELKQFLTDVDKAAEIESETDEEAEVKKARVVKRRRHVAIRLHPAQAEAHLRSARKQLIIFADGSESVARCQLEETPLSFLYSLIILAQRSLLVNGGDALSALPAAFAAFRRLARAQPPEAKGLCMYMRKKSGTDLFGHVRAIVHEYLTHS
jgi:hypothetical protein